MNLVRSGGRVLEQAGSSTARWRTGSQPAAAKRPKADEKKDSNAADVHSDVEATNEHHRALHRQKTPHIRETHVRTRARARI